MFQPSMRRTALLSLLLALPAVALAKKPPLHSPVVPVTPYLGANDLLSQTGRYDRTSGAPLALYAVDALVSPGTPEAMARQYLRQSAAQLGLLDATLGDLQFVSSRSSQAGTNVRFEQRYLGVPVFGSRLVVHISPKNLVTQVQSGYKAKLDLASIVPLISATQARAGVVSRLKAEAPFRFDETVLNVYQAANRSHLVWKVTLSAAKPFGNWQALIDATSGETLAIWDRSAYASASGVSFDPDPLGSSHGKYTLPIQDNGDADDPVINAQIKTVALGEIAFDGGQYFLKNEWAEVTDHETPSEGLFKQASPAFAFTREQQGFEASMTFFQIQKSMQYINNTLGIALRPYQYTGGVQFDPQGLDGEDNSHYDSSTGQLAFGEGCVDDNEDADVIWHELGHGLHDWVTDGGLSNMVDGLSEGFGDYWAASYSRSLKQWTKDEPEYNWVYSWDGHSDECWAGRVTNYATKYPLGVKPYPLIHESGQMISTCLMTIYDEIGRQKTDTIALEGIGMGNELSTQNDAANGILQAAEDLGYPAADVAKVDAALSACGYVLGIPSTNTGTASANPPPPAPPASSGSGSTKTPEPAAAIREVPATVGGSMPAALLSLLALAALRRRAVLRAR